MTHAGAVVCGIAGAISFQIWCVSLPMRSRSSAVTNDQPPNTFACMSSFQPPKTFFCRDLNPDFLSRRKTLLENFLHDLLVIPGVTDENSVREFLLLQSNKTLFV